MYIHCWAITEKIEIVCNLNVAKMLGGYYNFSSDLLSVLAKINRCVWTDLFLIVYDSLMQGENTSAGEQGTHNQWVAFAQASFTMHKETL